MLSLEQGLLVPVAGLENVNPKLRLKEWNISIPPETIRWPGSGPRRASVNSFGFGGANAHVILEDAAGFLDKGRSPDGTHREVLMNGNSSATAKKHVANGFNGSGHDNSHRSSFKLFVFSSADREGLERVAKGYVQFLCGKEYSSAEDATPSYSDDLAFTLAHRRTVFDNRSFAVAHSIGDLADQLTRGLNKFISPSRAHGIAYVFTGQGAQWAGMGMELLEVPVFAASISRSKSCLESLGCPWNLRHELEKLTDSSVDQPEYSQPLCTAVQVGLVDLLRHWGIEAKAVVGHSSGEIGMYRSKVIL